MDKISIQLSKIHKSHLGDIAILLSGSVITAVLSFLAAPILTRIYPPSDFGYLAIFLAIVNSLFPAATLRYELSINMHHNNKLSQYGILLSIVISLFVCFIIELMILIQPSILLTIFNSSEMKPYIYFIPVSIFCLSLITTFGYWFTHIKKFHCQTTAQIVQTIIRLASQILFGFLGSLQSAGLLIGQILAHIAGALLAVFLYFKHTQKKQRLLSINYNTLKSFAFKHINLPKHTITTNLINGVAGNLFPVLLAYYFSPAAAGLLFLAQQLLEAPFGMINKALWRVSYGKLSKETKKPHIAYRTLRKIHSNVSLLYSIPVLVLISFSEYSSIIFGESWKDFALIIPGYCFYVYFKNLSNATSYFTIFHKFTQESVWNIINLTVRILSIIIAANITDDPINCITIYCFISSLVYIGINTYWGLVSLQLGVFWENIAITIIPVLTIAYLISNFTNSLLNKLLLTSIFLVLFLFLSIKRLRKIG